MYLFFVAIYWFTCDQYNLDKSLAFSVSMWGWKRNKNTYQYYVDGTECTRAMIITIKNKEIKSETPALTDTKALYTQLSFQFCCVPLSGTETQHSPSIGVDVSLIIVSGRVWSCTIICMVPIVWVRLCWAVAHWCGSLRLVIAGLINYAEPKGIQIYCMRYPSP